MRPFAIASLLLFSVVSGCTTTGWSYPYPKAPSKVRAEQKEWYSDGSFRFDAVEKDPRHREVFRKIDREVDEAVKDHPQKGELGFIHTWHETKRRILYWRYGIDWHPVDAMTPGLMVD